MDESVRERLEAIEAKLDLILECLGKMEKSTRNMDNHIDFVEDTMRSLRNTKLLRLIGLGSALQIENNNK